MKRGLEYYLLNTVQDTMQERTRHPDPPREARLTPQAFLDMVEERPNGEYWELIEGVAILNAAPTTWHQRIIQNISGVLDAAKEAQGATWMPLLGVSTRVPASPGSLPRPDFFVLEGEMIETHTTDNALVVFEVLSRSNTKKDRDWRKQVYGSISNCQQYVTISAKKLEVVCHDRASGWAEGRLRRVEDTLELPVINVSIPLGNIYKWTPIK
jgi:Uma2 family endonuclease